MTQDKALRNALKKGQNHSLPFGFNEQMMIRVRKAAEKRKNRAFAYTIGLISITSLGLIALAVFLLKDYLNATIIFPAEWFHPDPETISQYGFGFYIALLTLVLIGIDHLVRHHWQKRREKN